MKSLVCGTLLILFTQSLFAVPYCHQQSYRFQQFHVTAGFFKALAPQGLVFFIPGPGESFAESKVFIQSLCARGFHVLSFNEETRRSAEKHYLMVAEKMAVQFKKVYPRLPITFYGRGEGAEFAAALANKKQYTASRLVLENPVLDSKLLSRIDLVRSSVKKRIFLCPSDLRVPKQQLARISRTTSILMPAGVGDCSNHLNMSPEAQAPMLDYIEGDLSGAPAASSNWYWHAI